MASSLTCFADWLTERCQFLHSLETEAARVLYEDKDEDKYRALMCQKAMFLKALPDEAGKLVADLPDDVAESVYERLEAFSVNAARALSLDSCFYMSALLYPDDHKPGEPNNLDKLAAEIAALAAQS